MLNHSVEREVVKGLAFDLLCFAVGVGVGLVRSSCCLLFCRSFRADQSVRRSGSVSTNDSKGYHFSDFLQDLCCARQQMQCDFHAIEFIHFGGLCTKMQLVAVERNQIGETREHDDVAGIATICIRLGFLYFYALMATMRIRLFLVVC